MTSDSSDVEVGVQTAFATTRQTISSELLKTLSTSPFEPSHPYLREVEDLKNMWPDFPEEMIELYAKFPQAAKEVIGRPGWNNVVATRSGLYAQWLMKMAWQHPIKNEAKPRGRDHTAALGVWDRLSEEMFEAEADSGVIVSPGNEISAPIALFGKIVPENFRESCLDQMNEDNWPIEIIGDRVFFKDPLTFYLLLSDRFLTDEEDLGPHFLGLNQIGIGFHADIGTVIERLDKAESFEIEELSKNFMLLLIIGERIFLWPDKNGGVDDYLVGIARKMGGKEGVDLAYAVYRDISSIYSKLDISKSPRHVLGPILTKEKIAESLDKAKRAIQTEERIVMYPNREVVVKPEVIDQALTRARALGDPREFWQDVFIRSGVDFKMTQRFERGKYKADLEDFYESALAERKQIAVEILATADMVGFDPKKALALAAGAQLFWGEAVIPIDNAAGVHKRRKGLDTAVAREGVGPAIEKSMVALGGIFKDAFGEKAGGKVGLELAETLESTFGGSVRLRDLGWDSGYGEHRKNIGRLISAFSLFTRYMGEQSGFPEATKYLALAQRLGHTLGQINNAMEVVNPPGEKHEAGSDVGQVTIFWKTLTELPEDVVGTDEKDFVKRVFDAESDRKISGRPRTPDEESDFEKVLRLGGRYQGDVARALESKARMLYERSKRCIDKAVKLLPRVDQRVEKAREVFLFGADYQWDKFQSFIPRDEAEGAPIPIDTTMLSPKTPVPVEVN